MRIVLLLWEYPSSRFGGELDAHFLAQLPRTPMGAYPRYISEPGRRFCRRACNAEPFARHINLTLQISRPLLFRASSVAPVRSFAKSSLVSYPHGNVLSADAFARGVIRSGTDYEIYNNGFGNGTYAMEGIDFAFYQGRAQYHTKYDSIPGAGGARRSLWAMMDSVLGAGWSLLNDDETHVDIEKGPEAPVYFDGKGLF